MIENGLEAEVRGLMAQGVTPDLQSMQGLGYKEMARHLAGEWAMEKTIDEIQKGTRHYAKRQETFLRREPDIQTFDVLAPDAAERAEKILL